MKLLAILSVGILGMMSVAQAGYYNKPHTRNCYTAYNRWTRQNQRVCEGCGDYECNKACRSDWNQRGKCEIFGCYCSQVKFGFFVSFLKISSKYLIFSFNISKNKKKIKKNIKKIILIRLHYLPNPKSLLTNQSIRMIEKKTNTVYFTTFYYLGKKKHQKKVQKKIF